MEGVIVHTLQQRTKVRATSMRGFTLLEIMVVVVILGILGALIVPNMFDQVDKARIEKARQDIKVIEAALDMYRLDNFRYPTTEQGLKALIEKPTDGNVRNWKRYLRDLQKDPWDQEYRYSNPGAHGREVDIYTYGADGQEGGEGNDADIGNWDSSKS
jgi:general secretion pathway protein G